jgi:transposase InsO family protein
MVELRRQRCTGLQIAQRLHVSPATVARYLKISGLSRLKNLEPKEPIRRYEKERPGELIHLDIKKLGRIRGIGHRITGDRRGRRRGSGWEFVHVAIDDASRLSYVEILKDEKACSSVAFLQRATAWYQSQGISVERLLTDNGSGYVSHLFAAACRSLDLRHSFTRPYRPRTNGKAERFIQTLLREWAYRRPYKTSYQRQRRLRSYLQHYNLFRPHAGLNRKTPISRLRTVNNLLRNDT